MSNIYEAYSKLEEVNQLQQEVIHDLFTILCEYIGTEEAEKLDCYKKMEKIHEIS